MFNLNTKADAQQTYDAIVIGSGISGGWAAKELCEKGLKTPVLERGRMVEHLKDYPTMNMAPWDLPSGDRLTPREIKEDYWVTNPSFFLLLKELTLLGFFASEPGATEVLNYDPVPGGYTGCAPLEEVGGKTWAM